MPGKRYRHRSRLDASATRETREPRYVLRLYVTGLTSRSTKALQRTRDICEEYLAGRYDLQVIDLYQQPALARQEDILASPTLVKMAPLPRRKLVGNLSDRERVLRGLALRA